MSRKKLRAAENKAQKVAEKEKRMIEREQKRKVALEEKARKYAEKQKQQKSLLNYRRNCIPVPLKSRCPVCGAIYEEDESDSLWIGCDNCDLWYCLKCTNVSEDNIPDVYHCDRC